MRIHTEEIPQYQKEALAAAAIRLTKEVFSTPRAEEDYQKWLVKRNEQKSKNSRNGE